MLASSSHVLPLFTGPVFCHMPEQSDSSDDEMLPAWFDLLRGSDSVAAGGFIPEMGQTSASADLPDAGLSAWAPMPADEFYASRASVRPVSHSTRQPSASCHLEGQHPTTSDSSENEGSDGDGHIRSSSPLPVGANPLDYLSRGTVVFPAFNLGLVYFIHSMFSAANDFSPAFRSCCNSLCVCTSGFL